MDLTAEFYLETIARVFIDHDLPRGTLRHRGQPVDLGAIRRCHLMAIEGEKDDITGIGQTKAALDLATGLPESAKAYHLQRAAGHYGIFNGSRFRAEIVPLMRSFMERSVTQPAAAPDTRPILVPTELTQAQPHHQAASPRAPRRDWIAARERHGAQGNAEKRIAG